jgi:hypothetical protein
MRSEDEVGDGVFAKYDEDGGSQWSADELQAYTEAEEGWF